MAARGLGQQVTAALEEWRAANPMLETAKPPQVVTETLKQVYGEQYHAELDSRSAGDIIELAGNLQNGVPMGTPVFDGAREADVTEMLHLASLPGSGR